MKIQGLTATEQRVMDILSDGYSHLAKELVETFNDPDQAHYKRSVAKVITQIRKFIRPKGMDIVCVVDNRRYKYLLVRRMVSPVE